MMRFRGMRWLYMVIMGCSMMLISNPLLAQENSVPEEPTLIVRITPPKPYLQEEIVQVVRVIAPHPFEELVLDLPTIPDAEIVTLQQPRNRKFQTYGGEGYIYETRRAIFPKKSGELRIPPVRISGSIGISRNEKKPFVLRSEGKVMDVRPPPDAFTEDWWLVARDVKIDQGWSQSLETLRVGDRVTRSISVTVAGVTGAHLPELEQGRSTGLTVLPGRTERSTEITPGGVVGKIERTFDIRVDVDQPINISPVRVVWWNTNTEIERRSAAPAVRLEPLPRDVEGLVSELMTEAAIARDNSRSGIFAIALSSLALLIGLAFYLLKAQQRVRPEDRRLQKTLMKDSSPIGSVRALRTWSEAAFSDERSMSLEELGQRLGPRAEETIARLQQAAFGQSVASTDFTSMALDIIRIAQERRSRPLSDVISGLLDRLLGVSRRLPEIGGTHVERFR